MSRPVTRYRRASVYGWLALSALVGSLFSAWLGLHAIYCFIPAGLFAATAAWLLWLATRPTIEIYDSHLAVGEKRILWTEIVSVDATGWVVPLVVRISALDGSHLLFYPGDRMTGAELLATLRRMARSAIIDGVPYAQFWGETPGVAAPESDRVPLPRPRLLLPEDEREVEQMYQRLKSEGYLESQDRSRGARDQ